MRREPPTAEADTSLELRVLEGEQRGARLALRRADFEIGSLHGAAACDVRLRDALIGDTLVRISLDGEEPHARLHVLAGEVRLGPRRLRAGSAARWRLYAPLRIGATVIALGEEDGAAWERDEPAPIADEDEDDEEAASTANAELASGPPPSPPPHLHRPPEQVAEPAQITDARRARGLERRLAVFGAALVLAAALPLAIGRLTAPPTAPAGADPQVALARLLAAQPGWRGLRVEADAAGDTVQGLLDTNAQREDLRALLARAGFGGVRIDVRTGEQLVDAVDDLFRVQGVPARADYDGAGRVRVYAQETDANLLLRVVAAARRDVRGLADIDVHNAPPVPPPQDRPVPDDPGKRVAAVVPGASPYVATVDGTRYFLGALLPTGDRIEAIDAHRILLVRDGRRSELEF
jgi:type III secretion protein D